MKIAFCIRSDYERRHGGDVVQMLETKEKILENAENIKITIITNPADINSSYDICHIFNYSTVKETELFFLQAKRKGCKIVSSPIFWDYRVTAYSIFCSLGIIYLSSFFLQLEIRILNFINYFYPLFFHNSSRFSKKVLFFLENSDYVLPNSEEEMDLLMRFVNQDKANYRYKVILNASIDFEEIKYLDEVEFTSKFNLPKDYILQVGRIEPIKNQISLVKSLFSFPEIPIVFLGRSIHRKYFEKLKKMSDKRGNVYFVDEVNHSEVSSFYRYAKLHVLPSLRESPGLSSLEALTNGCKVLVSKFPYSPYETYFKGKAMAFDPLDPISIKSSILSCYFGKNKKEIVFDLSDKFTWRQVGIEMINIYEKIKV
jgi:glycosyltransferase involved in cell wall biosynthesis